MTACIGIDVQSARECPYVVLDAALQHQDSGWLAVPEDLLPIVTRVRAVHGAVAVGIDAPRCPLPAPREHYWSRGAWRQRRPADSGHGRHCEVVLKTTGLANPQWTPMAGACPAWMEVGFRLFGVLSAVADVYEVFPSAAYAQLVESKEAIINISLKGFAYGPKDMLDAYVAAYTVAEYLAGRGVAVGGGDGLGEIILPRPLRRELLATMTWPATASQANLSPLASGPVLRKTR